MLNRYCNHHVKYHGKTSIISCKTWMLLLRKKYISEIDLHAKFEIDSTLLECINKRYKNIYVTDVSLFTMHGNSRFCSKLCSETH